MSFSSWLEPIIREHQVGPHGNLLPGLSNRYEDAAGPPPAKGSATESPWGGRSLAKGKRNCCNGSLKAGWLLRRPSLWQALCCGCGRCEFSSHTREVGSGSCSSHDEEAWTERKACSSHCGQVAMSCPHLFREHCCFQGCSGGGGWTLTPLRAMASGTGMVPWGSTE